MASTSRLLVGLALALAFSGPSAFAHAAAAGDAAPDFFTVHRDPSGVWWLRSPEGDDRFLSLGVCQVTRSGDAIRGTQRFPYLEATDRIYHQSASDWRTATTRRLRDWGFNTLGAWSSPALAAAEVDGRRLAYVVNLDLGADFVRSRLGGDGPVAWLHGVFPDVFDPAFEAHARRVASERCAPLREDRHLLGWFLDNELKWSPDWRGPAELIEQFLAAPPDSPGRVAALDLLEKRHPAIATFNASWGVAFADWPAARAAARIEHPRRRAAAPGATAPLQNQNAARAGEAALIADCDAFLALAAERYFTVATAAVRAADPHHLLLGCRFPIVVPAPVRAAAGRHCDVVSINSYAPDPRGDIRAYADTGRPVMIGEYTFRGADAGLPNENKGLPIVATQADRARAVEAYLRAAFAEPAVVGAHWFQWTDQPREGRFDGENSNVGLVSIEDIPHAALAEAFTRVNAGLPALHARASASP